MPDTKDIRAKIVSTVLDWLEDRIRSLKRRNNKQMENHPVKKEE